MKNELLDKGIILPSGEISLENLTTDKPATENLTQLNKDIVGGHNQNPQHQSVFTGGAFQCLIQHS